MKEKQGLPIYQKLYETKNKSNKVLILLYTIEYNIEKEKEVIKMSVTASEFKANLGKYLDLANTEDIYITRNGKVIAKLSTPYPDLKETVDSLVGILPQTATLDEAREERMSQI